MRRLQFIIRGTRPVNRRLDNVLRVLDLGINSVGVEFAHRVTLTVDDAFKGDAAALVRAAYVDAGCTIASIEEVDNAKPCPRHLS